MKKIKAFLFGLVTPGLFLTYTQTGNEGIYFLVGLLVWVAFLAMLLTAIASSTVKSEMPRPQLLEIRQAYGNMTNFYVNTLVAATLVLGLFWYGKVVIGTVYLLTCALSLGIRSHFMKEDEDEDNEFREG